MSKYHVRACSFEKTDTEWERVLRYTLYHIHMRDLVDHITMESSSSEDAAVCRREHQRDSLKKLEKLTYHSYITSTESNQ